MRMPGETGEGTGTPTTPPEGTPPGAGNPPAAVKKERKAPVPSSTLIGTWDESKTTFSLKARLEDATDADKAKAIKELGYGKYTVLTVREVVREFKKVEKDRLI